MLWLKSTVLLTSANPVILQAPHLPPCQIDLCLALDLQCQIISLNIYIFFFLIDNDYSVEYLISFLVFLLCSSSDHEV